MKFILPLLFISWLGIAQTLPNSDIYLFTIKKTGNTLTVKKGENITKRVGYDNQPFFTPDNQSLLFVSIKEDKQADIYKYELGSKKIKQVTKTSLSEYSPIITPDEKFISAVVVERDSTQRIYKYDIKGKSAPTLLFDEDSIGYYCWLNKDSILYYKLTSPHSLYAYDLKNKRSVWIANEPGRAFKPINEFRFFYCVKEKNENMLRTYNVRLKKSELYSSVKKENEDFVWEQTLGLIKSEESKLLRYNEEIKTWVEIADFSAFGVGKITRFAFSPNGKYIAVVGNK